MTSPPPVHDAPDAARRPVSVYVLDDHALLRRGLIACLAEAGGFDVVGQAGTAQEALEQIPVLRPAVALLDVRLPDGSGVDVCRQVRAACPGVRLVMLTSFDDDDARLASTLAGAAGFVLKDIEGDDLCTAVRRVAAGESLMNASDRLAAITAVQSRDADPRVAALTAQERRILTLLGEGLSNRQIAAKLNLTEHTARNYVSTVLQKMGFQRRSQAGIFAATRR